MSAHGSGAGASRPRIKVDGPLAPYAVGWRAELAARGYARGSAASQMRLMEHLSRYLDERGLAAADLTVQAAGRFLAERRAGAHPGLASPRALGPLLGYLRGIGAVPVRRCSRRPSSWLQCRTASMSSPTTPASSRDQAARRMARLATACSLGVTAIPRPVVAAREIMPLSSRLRRGRLLAAGTAAVPGRRPRRPGHGDSPHHAPPYPWAPPCWPAPPPR
jgi:hypothetical protein